MTPGCPSTITAWGKKLHCRLLEGHQDKGKAHVVQTWLRVRDSGTRRRIIVLTIRWRDNDGGH
jgi:hypothetical protein